MVDNLVAQLRSIHLVLMLACGTIFVALQFSGDETNDKARAELQSIRKFVRNYNPNFLNQIISLEAKNEWKSLATTSYTGIVSVPTLTAPLRIFFNGPSYVLSGDLKPLEDRINSVVPIGLLPIRVFSKDEQRYHLGWNPATGSLQGFHQIWDALSPPASIVLLDPSEQKEALIIVTRSNVKNNVTVEITAGKSESEQNPDSDLSPIIPVQIDGGFLKASTDPEATHYHGVRILRPPAMSGADGIPYAQPADKTTIVDVSINASLGGMKTKNLNLQQDFCRTLGADWNVGTFDQAFPELAKTAAQLEGLSLGDLEKVFDSDYFSHEKTTKILEIELPTTALSKAGIILICLVQLYFFVHLQMLTKLFAAENDLITEPWTVLYSGILATILNISTLGLMPITVAFLVAYKSFPETIALLGSFGCTTLAILTVVQYWSLSTAWLKRANHPKGNPSSALITSAKFNRRRRRRT